MIVMYKKEGELLSELVVRARAEYQIPEQESVTYAGRLDPMASGIMVLLVGKEEIAQEKTHVLNMSKGYEFEVLFGVSTDTHDALGIIDTENIFGVPIKSLNENEIGTAVAKYNNIPYEQTYPHFSSKPVDGKPLFVWAKDSIKKELPIHLVTIHETKFLGIRKMKGVEIAQNAIMRVQNIHGDFRQNEIIHSWQDFVQKNGDNIYCIAKIHADVSSGAYIRVLACDIARDLGTCAIALTITRTRNGIWRDVTPKLC